MMFESSSSINTDGCSVAQRELDARLLASYVLTNLRPKPSEEEAECADFALKHRNLRPWDGYGWNVGDVESDSHLRLDGQRTRPQSRLQLCSRVFSAAPALCRATGDPALESRVRQSVDTSCIKRAPGVRVAETDFHRFDPGYCPVPVEHVVPVWTAGGASSRDIARTRRFRKAFSASSSPSCGGTKAWRRLVSMASQGIGMPGDGYGAGSGV
jgi:hypothetical protein